jgi:hypothetical protein
MLQLQLFIEGKQVELHDNESISLTQTLQDVLDVQKVFTDYTRTFNVPASKENNKIFKHFHNPAIVGNLIQTKRPAELFLNYKPFKVGKIKLESVEVKNHSPVNYRITFFGNTVELKDILGEALLSDLDILSTNLTYRASDVKTYAQDGIDLIVQGEDVADAVIYPLISKERRLYYDSGEDVAGTGNLYYGTTSHGVVFDDLKPAIRIHAILLAIKKQYNLKFSDDFFNSNNPDYYNLYLWLHKQKGAFKSQLTDADRNNWQRATGQWANVFGDTELKKGFYGSAGYGYKNFGNYKGNRYIAINVETTAGVEYTVAIYGHGEKLFEGDFTGSQEIVSITSALKMKKQAVYGNVVQPYSYNINIKSASNATFTVNWTVLDAQDLEATKAYAQNTIVTTVNYTTTVSQEMPKMKVIDFLVSLFKMFNLTAYYKDGEIQVLPLSDWYAASTKTHDITEYLDHTNSEVSIKFPYANIDFGYEGLESFFSSYHSQYNNLDWGGLTYRNEADPTGESYDLHLPFEHHKFERLKDVTTGNYTTAQWGWSVNKDEEPMLGKPLVFYAHKVTNGTAITFLETASGTRHSLTDYFIPSNSSDPTSDSQTIHFGAEKSEYTRNSSNKSLFQTYYRDYIEEVFDESRRLFKYKAYLPLSILMDLNLNDKVIIFNELYKINKITTNFQNNLTNLELVNEVQDFEVALDQIIADDTETVDTGLATADTTLVTADTTVLRW